MGDLAYIEKMLTSFTKVVSTINYLVCHSCLLSQIYYVISNLSFEILTVWYNTTIYTQDAFIMSREIYIYIYSSSLYINYFQVLLADVALTYVIV